MFYEKISHKTNPEPYFYILSHQLRFHPPQFQMLQQCYLQNYWRLSILRLSMFIFVLSIGINSFNR